MILILTAGEELSSATQNTRRAEAYGSAVITGFTTAENGAISRLASERFRCTRFLLYSA